MTNLKKLFFDWFLYPLEQVYRRVFRPKTFGVRVLVWDKETNKVLMVRHTYGDKTMWHFPGGAYNPNRELASDSARRELAEETGLVAPTLMPLITYKTDAQGNDDTVEVFVNIFNLEPQKQAATISDPEVAEVKWYDLDELLETPKVYRITRQSVRQLKRMQKEPSS